MSQITTITVSDEVHYSKEYQELKRTRKLSGFIDSLLKASLNIAKQEVSQEKEVLELELVELNARKVLLEQKKEEIETAEKKEESRWKRIY
jgi:hypothetical protein